VLSSQIPRPGLNRRYMSSTGKRRGGGRRWGLALLLLLLLGLFFFWLIGRGGDPEQAAASEDGNDRNKQTSEADDAQATGIAARQADPSQDAARSETRSPDAPPAHREDRAGLGLLPVSRHSPAADMSREDSGPTSSSAAGGASSFSATRRADADESDPTPQAAHSPAPHGSSAASGRKANSPTPADLHARARRGLTLIADQKLLEGRRVLSRLLVRHGDELAPADAQALRDTLTSVSEFAFTRGIPSDDLVETYTVRSGDRLARIAPRYHTPYAFIERINDTPAERIRVGQTLRMVKGPFHAVVDKSEFRLDVFLRDSEANWIYARSFPVGLGEDDSTPVGTWIVRPGSKVKNPAWTNPRTGESFSRDDPENPIGEYWLGLAGADERTGGRQSYGIHGTIDPQSIGRMRSMGCIRLRDADVRLLFHMLSEGQSTVVIRP